MTNEIETIRGLCAAFGVGQELEYTPVGGVLWGPVDTGNIGSLIYDFNRYTVRVKPEPAMVQLGPEDIDQHRDLFRCIMAPNKFYLATAKGCDTVTINNHAYKFYALRDSVARSIDGGYTWHRCEKLTETISPPSAQ